MWISQFSAEVENEMKKNSGYPNLMPKEKVLFSKANDQRQFNRNSITSFDFKGNRSQGNLIKTLIASFVFKGNRIFTALKAKDY